MRLVALCMSLLIRRALSMARAAGPRQLRIEQALAATFSPTVLEVLNESHGRHEDESHFKVVVVSDAFEGKRLVGRHRLRDEAVSEDDGSLSFHSLEIGAAKTPAEWAENDSVPASPKCAGGDGSGIVSLIGVTDETFHNQNISMDVDSYIEQMDQAQEPGTHHEPFGINSIVVHGMEKSYGSGNAAGWKLWVATSSLELVAIDPDRFECVEQISFAANNCEWLGQYCALASHGHILALDSGQSGTTLFELSLIHI